MQIHAFIGILFAILSLKVLHESIIGLGFHLFEKGGVVELVFDFTAEGYVSQKAERERNSTRIICTTAHRIERGGGGGGPNRPIFHFSGQPAILTQPMKECHEGLERLGRLYDVSFLVVGFLHVATGE